MTANCEDFKVISEENKENADEIEIKAVSLIEGLGGIKICEEKPKFQQRLERVNSFSEESSKCFHDEVH